MSTCSPYSIVESDGFLNLMKTTSPNYIVPSRTNFSERIIPGLYIKMKDHLKIILKDAANISFTADGWTGINQSQFLGVTGTLIDNDWKLQTYTLAVRQLNTEHTADNIASAISEVLEEYTINVEKIVSITTDRAANMLAAVGNLDVPSVPCFAHAINTVVTKTLKHKSLAPI